MKNKINLALLSGLSAVALAACGSSPNGVASKKAAKFRQPNQEAGVRPHLSVGPQHSGGDALRVASVRLPERSVLHQSAGHGYVAVASDQGGKPGDILGFAKVKDGTSKNVTVRTGSKLQSGRYFVLLFESNRAPSSVSGALTRSLVTVSAG